MPIFFFLCLITCQARDSMKFLSAFLKYRHMGLCRYRHNIPAFPINADDFFFGKLRIRAYNYQPVLPLAFIADVHKFCRNAFAFFFNRYRHRKKITGASPAFFVPAVDFLHVKFFTVVQVFRPGFLAQSWSLVWKTSCQTRHIGQWCLHTGQNGSVPPWHL